MRFLSVSLLILCALSATAQQPQQKAASPPQRASQSGPAVQHTAPAKSKPPAQTAPADGSKTETPPAATDPVRPTLNYWDQVESPEVLPKWILMAVGVLGTLAAVFTLWSISRHMKGAREEIQKAVDSAATVAEAARGSSQAAARTADALLLADRAWLLVPEDKIQDPYIVSVESTNEQLSHCVFCFKNFGKTPAYVFSEYFEIQIGDNWGAPPQPDRIYGLAVDPARTPYMIPQDEITPREAPLIWGFVSKTEIDRISEKRNGTLWLCGFVRYRDVFDTDQNREEHETRFCYLWETHLNTPKCFWRRAGPAEYNRAT